MNERNFFYLFLCKYTSYVFVALRQCFSLQSFAPLNDGGVSVTLQYLSTYDKRL